MCSILFPLLRKDVHVPPTPREDVLAAYEWQPGTCYRCGRDAERTAVVGRLLQQQGAVPIRACETCTLTLERFREAAAERYGWPYVPGEQSP